MPLVELRGIVKTFPPDVRASNGVSVAVGHGEILALLGENGAGKSTLMQILYGLYRPDAGEIRVRGQPVRLASPGEAIRHGIGMIHQDFLLVRSFTVAENVAMGTAHAERFDLRAVAARLAALAARFGLGVDPAATVEHLPVGVQQRVEILKLLYQDADLLILDEPTAVLTPQEVTGLFAVLRTLKAAGKSVVIVTHKLREVMDIADRVVVLRDGNVVGEADPKATTEAELARLMVGRDVLLRATRPARAPGPVRLSVENLTVQAVRDLSLRLHAGEILGIAGIDGNGQSELVEALFGLRPRRSGRIVLEGHDITTLSPAARRALGLAWLPADRRHVASVPELSLADNSILGAQRGFSRAGWRSRKRATAHAKDLIARFGIRAPGADFPAGKLSGGNLQKLVLGRELSRDPQVLLAEQPTRGLDVGAIETVWAELLAQRAAGRAILLVSAELEEILNLSDRIAVMHAGRIVGILPNDGVDVARLGLMMAGTA